METEVHVESDEEVPEDDYNVAKASSKKERKKQEREAQRQVKYHFRTLSLSYMLFQCYVMTSPFKFRPKKQHENQEKRNKTAMLICEGRRMRNVKHKNACWLVTVIICIHNHRQLKILNSQFI